MQRVGQAIDSDRPEDQRSARAIVTGPAALTRPTPLVFRVPVVPSCLILAAVVAGFGANACGSPAPWASSPSDAATVSDAQRTYTRLYSATTSEYTEPAEQVLRSPAELAAVWRGIHPGVSGDPVPTVDFTKRMVVFLAMGQRRTGGYALHFDGVSNAPGGALVRYTVTAPGPDCMTAQMLTAPVELVSVPRVDGTVQFQRKQVVGTC